MLKRADVVVVGAGIAGLAHAWAAARAGRSVAIFERSPYARGASIRNFGMVWPTGQPAGETYAAAMRSRELWLEAAEVGGFWLNPVGSICLAVHEDELAVMREHVDTGTGSASRCELLTAEQAYHRCPAANREHVIGGMYSDSEVGVDPRQAIAAIAQMLVDRHDVQIAFDRPVVGVSPGRVDLAGGDVVEASERVVICSGADTRLLYPELFEQADVVPCKLQMFATASQPSDWSLTPMVCSGPSLGHYEAYAKCPSLEAMKQRISREQPDLQAYGIHYLAAQHLDGDVILGDSHEYGGDYGPDLSDTIEQTMLRGLQELLSLPDWSIKRRWQGIYLKSRRSTYLLEEPEPGVLIFNGLGGAGMTLSFGLADRYWNDSGAVKHSDAAASCLESKKGTHVA